MGCYCDFEVCFFFITDVNHETSKNHKGEEPFLKTLFSNNIYKHSSCILHHIVVYFFGMCCSKFCMSQSSRLAGGGRVCTVNHLTELMTNDFSMFLLQPLTLVSHSVKRLLELKSISKSLFSNHSMELSEQD